MKRISLLAMSVFYIAAGLNHFLQPEFYLKLMPSWLPLRDELVLYSGIFEILFGLLLLFPLTRRIAAWGIILLLIAVFPANIQMMISYWEESNPKLWISIVRVPLQLILIWWAYGFAKKAGYSQESS